MNMQTTRKTIKMNWWMTWRKVDLWMSHKSCVTIVVSNPKNYKANWSSSRSPWQIHHCIHHHHHHHHHHWGSFRSIIPAIVIVAELMLYYQLAHKHCELTLNVIIEGQILVPVLGQESEGIGIGKVLKLHQSTLAIPGKDDMIEFNKLLLQMLYLLTFSIRKIEIKKIGDKLQGVKNRSTQPPDNRLHELLDEHVVPVTSDTLVSRSNVHRVIQKGLQQKGGHCPRSPSSGRW